MTALEQLGYALGRGFARGFAGGMQTSALEADRRRSEDESASTLPLADRASVVTAEKPSRNSAPPQIRAAMRTSEASSSGGGFDAAHVEPSVKFECSYCPRVFTVEPERTHHQAKVCRNRPRPELVPVPAEPVAVPLPAPRRFQKVTVPASSRVRLDAAAIGEVVDPRAAFKDEDARARARIEEAIRAGRGNDEPNEVLNGR